MKRTPCPGGDRRVPAGMRFRSDARSPTRCRLRAARNGQGQRSSHAGCPARSAAERRRRTSARGRYRSASPPSSRLAWRMQTYNSMRPWRPQRYARDAPWSAPAWGRRSRRTASRQLGGSVASSASGVWRTPYSVHRTACNGRSAGSQTQPGIPPTIASASHPCGVALDGCARSRVGRRQQVRWVCRAAAARARLRPCRKRSPSQARRHQLARRTL